jgi:hypothetical protein
MAAVIQAPCKGCEKREIGCHGWCKAYLAYQEENNMYKAMSANNRKSLSPTKSFTKRQRELIRKGMKCVR